MQESKFFEELQKRATEQKRLHTDIPFPYFFALVARLLGDHPWRILIPLSLIVSFCLYSLVGRPYIELVLWLFKVF